MARSPWEPAVKKPSTKKPSVKKSPIPKSPRVPTQVPTLGVPPGPAGMDDQDEDDSPMMPPPRQMPRRPSMGR